MWRSGQLLRPLMAQTSDNLARQFGITREQQDAYALRSHSLGNQHPEWPLRRGDHAGRSEAGRLDHVTLDDHLFPIPPPRARKLRRLRPIVRDRRQRLGHRRRRRRTGGDHAGRAREAGTPVMGVVLPTQRGRRSATMGIVPRPRSARGRTGGIAVSDIDLFGSTRRSRAVSGGREVARAGSRPGQRERRRDRARTPLAPPGAPHLHAAGRDGPAQVRWGAAPPASAVVRGRDPARTSLSARGSHRRSVIDAGLIWSGHSARTPRDPAPLRVLIVHPRMRMRRRSPASDRTESSPG